MNFSILLLFYSSSVPLLVLSGSLWSAGVASSHAEISLLQHDTSFLYLFSYVYFSCAATFLKLYIKGAALSAARIWKVDPE